MESAMVVPVDEKPLSAVDLAAILGCTPEAVTQKFRKGHIKAIKTGPGSKAPWVTYPSWASDAIRRWNKSPQSA